MKKTYPRAIGDIISDMIDRTGLRPDMRRHTAEMLWPQIVGRHIASYTRSVRMENNTLHVWLTSAALKEELGYARENLRDRLNEALGEELVLNIAIH